jgi:shikimate dehydrogenase
MPHKREALELSRADALAVRVGSVNSLKREADGWHGRNTDVAGVREPLARLGLEPGRALVLGAGGAGQAAMEALRELGFSIQLSARQPRGLDNVTPWERRTELVHDVLINATAIGGDDNPWPNEVCARVVFDLAMAPRSRLCEHAKAAGAVALDALEMWVHQGAEQMSWFLDERVTAEELEALL